MFGEQPLRRKTAANLATYTELLALIRGMSSEEQSFWTKEIQKKKTLNQITEQTLKVIPTRQQSTKNLRGSVTRITRAPRYMSIVFLHASPDIVKDYDKIRGEGVFIPEPLDFKKEAVNIKQVLSAANKNINYSRCAATKESFINAL